MLWCLTPLSTIVQLYRGGSKPKYPEKTTCRKSLTNFSHNVELGWSGRVSSSSPTCDTLRVTLVTNPMISDFCQEWGKDINLYVKYRRVIFLLLCSSSCSFSIWFCNAPRFSWNIAKVGVNYQSINHSVDCVAVPIMSHILSLHFIICLIIYIHCLHYFIYLHQKCLNLHDMFLLILNVFKPTPWYV